MRVLYKSFVKSMLIALAATAVYAQAQSGTTLLAITDLDCNWKLDGQSQGGLKADDSKVIAVSLGKHLVQATSTDGQDEWRTVINITQVGQEMVEIKLKASHDKRAADLDLQQHPTWTDPATGLIWARQVGGVSDFRYAADYCRNLRVEGYSDWNLATIDELAGVYDQAPGRGSKGFHIKGDIRLNEYSARVFSSTLVEPNAVHSLDFRTGNEQTIPRYWAADALCVRGSR